MSTIQPQGWEPPSHLSLGDVQFLSDREETIKNIQAASALLQGRVLLQVKRRFAGDGYLKDWFYPWATEVTATSKSTVDAMLACAEESEKDSRIEEALNTNAVRSLHEALKLPRSARDSILTKMSEGAKLSRNKIASIAHLPEVELEAAEESVERLEDLIAKWKIAALSATNSKERVNATSAKSQAEGRLEKAKQRLAELREKNTSLEVKMTAQEAVLFQLNRQLKEHKVRYEQATQDPTDFAARSEAKAVVEAEKAITDALISLERIADGYSTMPHDKRKALQLKLNKLNNVIATLNTEAKT